MAIPPGKRGYRQLAFRGFAPTFREADFAGLGHRHAYFGGWYNARVTNPDDIKPKPGDFVVLCAVPPGLLDDLPEGDRKAISEIVGKPIRLNEYEDDGRAELEFTDRTGLLHFIYVSPEFIRLK